MLVAIISDVHDNLPNLEKVISYCRQARIESLICCGDLATAETLDFLNDGFSGEIFFVFGNMDSEHLDMGLFKDGIYRNTTLFENFGEYRFDGKNAAFVHFPDAAQRLAETGRYDFVFYGHTHDPWEKRIGQCRMINPGNVANQKNPPTFAVWDTASGFVKLVRINGLK